MKQDIEYAALVMGERVIHDCNDRGARITGQEDEWNPLHDDGDSRRLEIACMKGMHSNDSNVPVHVWETDCQLDYARRAGNAQEYRAAVFALAVAIGKTIEGNDNAG
jgi:hypothetical protein